jgi:hypothetical protein
MYRLVLEDVLAVLVLAEAVEAEALAAVEIPRLTRSLCGDHQHPYDREVRGMLCGDHQHPYDREVRGMLCGDHQHPYDREVRGMLCGDHQHPYDREVRG